MHCVDPILKDLSTRTQPGSAAQAPFEVQQAHAQTDQPTTASRSARMTQLCAAGAGGVWVAGALERMPAGTLRLDTGPAAVPPVAGCAHACRWRPHAAPPGRHASGCCSVGHVQEAPPYHDSMLLVHAEALAEAIYLFQCPTALSGGLGDVGGHCLVLLASEPCRTLIPWPYPDQCSADAPCQASWSELALVRTSSATISRGLLLLWVSDAIKVTCVHAGSEATRCRLQLHGQRRAAQQGHDAALPAQLHHGPGAAARV